MESYEMESHANTDPAMVICKTPTKWHSNYTFYTMTNKDRNEFNNKINIVIRSVDISYIELDGSMILNAWRSIGSSGYSSGVVDIMAGVHQILTTNGATFSVILYGQRLKESYVLQAGQTPKPDITTVLITSQTPEPDITTVPITSQTPEPDITTVPTPSVTCITGSGNNQQCIRMYHKEPSKGGGVIITEGVVKGVAVIGRCAARCMMDRCMSLYVHVGNKTCVTYSTTAPQWIPNDSQWKFLVIDIA